MAERRDEVLATTPGADPATQELLATLATHLATHHPAWFTLHDGRLHNHLTHETHALTTDDPLATIGALTQEDFCLLAEEADGLRLTAAALCFPSRWRLSDKLGRLLGAIHTPVPSYAATLERPVDRFLRLLKTGRLAKRLNWSLIDDATLFQPTGHGRSAPVSRITPANAGQELVLRVERQTFRRLPATGAVVFGIRVHVTPLATVMAVPGEAARLRAATLALPHDMAVYKSMVPFLPALLAYLDQQAS